MQFMFFVKCNLHNKIMGIFYKSEDVDMSPKDISMDIFCILFPNVEQIYL